MLIILALTWHCTDSIIICIARGLKMKFPIGGCMMGEEMSASWPSMSKDNPFSDHGVTLFPIKD